MRQVKAKYVTVGRYKNDRFYRILEFDNDYQSLTNDARKIRALNYKKIPSVQVWHYKTFLNYEEVVRKQGTKEDLKKYRFYLALLHK